MPTSAAAQAQFVCNQVIGLTLTREWCQAGFEQAPGIADDRWQLKARQSGYTPSGRTPIVTFWNQQPQSPCANGSASPDHVVLTVLSWRPPCCATQAEWEAQVGKAVATVRSRYAGLKRIDLMTVSEVRVIRVVRYPQQPTNTSPCRRSSTRLSPVSRRSSPAWYLSDPKSRRLVAVVRRRRTSLDERRQRRSRESDRRLLRKT